MASKKLFLSLASAIHSGVCMDPKPHGLKGVTSFDSLNEIVLHTYMERNTARLRQKRVVVVWQQASDARIPLELARLFVEPPHRLAPLEGP